MEPYFYQCHYLDRGNPFLKLGPFYYEPLNDIPHVAIIRQFAFPSEMDDMKQQVIPVRPYSSMVTVVEFCRVSGKIQ